MDEVITRHARIIAASGSAARRVSPARASSDEPTIDQLLAEPIVQRLMARDGIEEEATRLLLQRAAANRAGVSVVRGDGRWPAEDETRQSIAIDDTPASQDAFGDPIVSALIGWLSGDESHDLDLSALAAGFGLRLRAVGIPLDRLALYTRTLHPLVRGGTLAWSPDEPIELSAFQHGADTAALVTNPVYHAVNAHEWVTVRLDDPHSKWSIPPPFRDRCLVELLVAPLLGADRHASAATFATRQPTGFSAPQRALLRNVVPALRTVAELRLLRLVEMTVLSTYVGPAAGQRIMAGHVRRGDVETLEAALMICDLRGFTALSNYLGGERVLQLLNVYFDQVVPAITEAGGEILKFMGDAVLAYFHDDKGAVASCVAAFKAAHTALERLAAASDMSGGLHAGVALHHGEMSYGNIGSGERLDFTVIGRDVNLVSRIESVCSATGKSLLMSERFARLLAAPHTFSIGRHDLKGFGEPIELFASTTVEDPPDSGAGERKGPMEGWRSRQQ